MIVLSVLRRRRGRRFKQRLVRLCRLPSSQHPASTAAAAAAAAAAGGGNDVEMTWFPWPALTAADDQPTHCSSVHAEFNPNYTSLELFSHGLDAVEHDLTEIPNDCLVVSRYVAWWCSGSAVDLRLFVVRSTFTTD